MHEHTVPRNRISKNIAEIFDGIVMVKVLNAFSLDDVNQVFFRENDRKWNWKAS